MGRPIKKKFFGNTNTPQIGGEGISSVIAIDNTGTHYSAGATLTFSGPQLPTGVTATGTPVVASAAAGGGITAVTLTLAGSGYTSTATISVTTASVVSRAGTGTSGQSVIYLASTTGLYTGMRVTGTGVGASSYVSTVGASSVNVTVANASTVTGTLVFMDAGTGFKAKTSLTAAKQNAISVTAYISTGSSAVAADIIKQEASQRYLVRTAQGVGQCKLVASNSPAAGQMYIVATDTNGSTYWVTKLTARRCRLTRRSMSGSYLFATGSTAGWTLGAASSGVVTISNA